ncbi:MAG TPA: helix-turn-helix domain-containing protein [Acidimicrobiales bacterium]|nr:helix-turn-helix domain-containing protein [Acidimicrobiales bacterium]
MASRQGAAAFEYTPTPAARRALRSVGEEEIATVRVVMTDGREVEVPEPLAAMLRTAVHEAATGHGLALVLSDEEVSPAKAGELLGLSRQYVDRLIAEGVLPARRLPGSTHRKLRVADVLEFAEQRDRRRKRIADMVDTMVDAGAEY